jgi:tetratricopeptide (TPR) repeat protein
MELQRPMFMSGKVMLDDGTPPPDSVRIERICGGRVIPEANTDRKGRFSFQVGQNSAMMADASTSGPGMRGGMESSGNNPMGGVREREMFNCELRASLAGYRSDNVNLANRKFMDNPDVGTIILHRLGNVEGLTISATSLNAPKDAKKLFEKGHDALGKNKLDDAQKHFEKAVELYPKYASAWYELGIVNERQKNLEGARKAFAQSLAADSKYMNPYDALAQMEARDQKWQDVADITDRMIRLNPVDFPRAYFYNAVAKLNLKRLDEAEKSAKALVEMDTRHQFPKGEQVLGVILAQRQDYTGAAAHIRKFITFSQPGADVDLAKRQLADLEKSLAAREQQP